MLCVPVVDYILYRLGAHTIKSSAQAWNASIASGGVEISMLKRWYAGRLQRMAGEYLSAHARST